MNFDIEVAGVFRVRFASETSNDVITFTNRKHFVQIKHSLLPMRVLSVWSLFHIRVNTPNQHTFIIHHSSFIIHHSSFIIHYSSFIIHDFSEVIKKKKRKPVEK